MVKRAKSAAAQAGKSPSLERAIPSAAPEKRKRRKTNAKAKSFEGEVLKGLRQRKRSWSARFTDKMTVDGSGKMVRAKGTESPPDMIHLSARFNALIECKLVTVEPGKEHLASIMFNRLEEHQERDLRLFSKISDMHHGFVAVAFYNGKLGKERLYRAWFIPIQLWVHLRSTVGRKSLTMRCLEEQDGWLEMQWVSGKDKSYWDASQIISAIELTTGRK